MFNFQNLVAMASQAMMKKMLALCRLKMPDCTQIKAIWFSLLALGRDSVDWKNNLLLVAAKLRMILTSFCPSCRLALRLLRNKVGSSFWAPSF